MNFSSKSGQNFDRPMYLERISRKMEECGKDDRKKIVCRSKSSLFHHVKLRCSPLYV